MNKVICVYSSSSNTIDGTYFDAAARLGREIARRGDVFLFGGGLTGLMGECARAVHRHGGHVVGVIPKALNEKGIVYEGCDELVVTEDMRTRKDVMDRRSDAFIALPGGFGTIEEVMEIITLKQLRYHNKPIVVLNVSGFYDHLLAQLDSIVRLNFAKDSCLDLFFVTDDAQAALDYIDTYVPVEVSERWMTDVHPAPDDTTARSASTSEPGACCKLEIFIPKTHLAALRDALRSVDAGHVGNYDSCLSYSEVTGCFRPLPGSAPYLGQQNTVECAEEYKVDALCLRSRVDETLRAIKKVHPYEVPVINVIELYKTGI